MACTLPTRRVSTAIRATGPRATPALPYRRLQTSSLNNGPVALRPRDVRVAFRPSDGKQDLIVSTGATKNKSKYLKPKNEKRAKPSKGKGESPNRDFLTLSVAGEYDTAIFFLLIPALALLFLPVLSLALGQLHEAYPNIFGPFL